MGPHRTDVLRRTGSTFEDGTPIGTLCRFGYSDRSGREQPKPVVDSVVSHRKSQANRPAAHGGRC